jgi:CubicO group peptidase (beta-lactamase class C family)
MTFTRRTTLGLGAVSMVALATAGRAAPVARARVQVIAPGPGADPAAVLAAIGDYAAAEMTAWGLPGLTMAVRGPKGMRAVLTLGVADIDRNVPVTPDQLFQIGSISKSLVALCLFRLAGQGRLDLDADMATVLPGAPLPVPVTVRQLLDHSGGLPDDAPLFPRVTNNMLWTGFTPGTGFSYSNVGYDLLGQLVAQLTGKTYAAAVSELVLVPLGMTHAESVIRTADRARYAVGYMPLRYNLPYFPGDQWAPGPWFDADIPAGSIAATPADMLRYLDCLSALAAGNGAGLMPDALAKRFVTPDIVAPIFGPGARYGNGLATIDIDGHPVLHHTGGMISFSSSMMFDPAIDAGAFASTNIGGIDYRPREITRYACRALRAFVAGKPVPPPAAITVVPAVTTPADYIGTYLASGGARIDIIAQGAGLSVVANGVTGRLKPAGPDEFLTDQPALASHSLSFVGDKGRRDRLWWGGTLFGRDTPLATPPVPPELGATRRPLSGQRSLGQQRFGCRARQHIGCRGAGADHACTGRELAFHQSRTGDGTAVVRWPARRADAARKFFGCGRLADQRYRRLRLNRRVRRATAAHDTI